MAVARQQALKAERTKPFQGLVRAGFVARGVTYGVTGGLALALALGAGSRSASPDQQGALKLITQAPLGWLAVAVIAAGVLTYAVWRLGQAVFGNGPEGGGSPSVKDRISNLASGLAYLGFFAVSVEVLTGSGGNGSQSGEQRHAAAGILGWPGGRFLIGLVGAGLVAVSAYQAYEALQDKFAQENKLGDMGETERRVFMLAGRIGLTARALVFALVGYFLIRAAIDFNPAKADGVDGALAQVHHQTFGPWLLGLVAVGLMIFAVFSILEARHRKL